MICNIELRLILRHHGYSWHVCR